MVVLTLEKCPLALRGDLTKWLQEISVGVYVGQVSARVREKIWQRVCEESRNGRATMVFSARNEQHYDFRVHNASWEPIDFDGLKLMMRPSPSRAKAHGKKRAGFSDESKRMRAYGRQAGKKPVSAAPREYVVFDLETTGLSPRSDEIFEIGAIRYRDGEEAKRYETVLLTSRPIPSAVKELTGVTDAELESAIPLGDALEEFLAFVGNSILVAHNASFDMAFLDHALETCGFEEMDNQVVDTLDLAKKKLPSVSGHRLTDLARRFGFNVSHAHRAIVDCQLTNDVYKELLELSQ